MIKIEDKEYHPREVLLIEVESDCANLNTGLTKGLIRYGKQTVELPAEAYQLLVRDHLEPEAEAYVELRKSAKRKLANWEKRQTNGQGNVTTMPLSAPTLFFEETGRYPKPLLSAKIVGSKGIPHTDSAAKEDRLLEMMNSDKEMKAVLVQLMQKLLDEKQEGKKAK